MSLLDAYRQKLEAQIQEHKAQLDLLKARAKRAAATSRILGYEELAEADKHLEHVKAKFKELKGAGGGALEEIKTGVKKALADLKVSTKKAAQHFNTRAPARPRARTTPHKPAKTRGH
jgi:multidrug resistance efflux pump